MRRRIAGALAAAGVGCALVGGAWWWAGTPEPRAPASSRGSDPMITLSPGDLGPRGAAPAGAPNLVLVIGCTVRQDQTTMYGGPDTTPFLASLAAEGARFADPITAAPWTRAASTAILTGHHPISVGMAEPAPTRDERVLPERVVTLPEHLRANGYATLGVTTNPNLNAVYGFAQGFDRYRQLAQLWRDDGTKLPGARAIGDALALLDARDDPRAPFYLQLVLIDAHAPFVASEAERAAFADPTVPEEVVRYRASLHRLDQAIARLDEALRARGYGPDDTVLAFTNDHGDGLGWPAHHGQSHGRYLAPSSVGGVVVVRGPGVRPGTVVPGVVSQVDLAPTLVGLLGLPPFPSDGFDASTVLRGESPRIARDRAFTETWFKDADRAAVYTDDEACQLDLDPARPAAKGPPFVDGCFHRAADPLHAAPFRDADAESGLREWRAERLVEAGAFGDVERTEPDAATAAQLEALGYTAR